MKEHSIGTHIHEQVEQYVASNEPRETALSMMRNAIDAATVAETKANEMSATGGHKVYQAQVWADISKAWSQIATVMSCLPVNELDPNADVLARVDERIKDHEDTGTDRAMLGRYIWCLMALRAQHTAVIPQHLWDRSGNEGSITIKVREQDGALVIARD